MTGIYNSTDGPLAIDRAGRMLAARSRDNVDDVDGSPLSGHIEAERIVIVELEEPTEDGDAAGEQDQPDAPTSTSTRTRKGRASTSTQEG